MSNTSNVNSNSAFLQHVNIYLVGMEICEMVRYKLYVHDTHTLISKFLLDFLVMFQKQNLYYFLIMFSRKKSPRKLSVIDRSLWHNKHQCDFFLLKVLSLCCSRMRRAEYCSAVGVSCGSDLACCSKNCAYGKCY